MIRCDRFPIRVDCQVVDGDQTVADRGPSVWHVAVAITRGAGQVGEKERGASVGVMASVAVVANTGRPMRLPMKPPCQ